MNLPSASIGVVTRNRAAILSRAIASALRQKGIDACVTVLDDGSTDETTALQTRFRDVTWLRRQEVGGHISARNELMARGDFDYFVSLDDDAWFLNDDEVAVAIEFLERNKSVAAIGFDILSADHPHVQERGTPETIATFIGCGHALRMSAVREVGAYELTPGRYGGEEKDLSLRLMDAGYKIIRLPGVHVWHEKTRVARQLLAQHRSGVCNDLVMTLRRTPLFLLPMAFLAKFYRHVIFSLKHGLLRQCLQGFSLFATSVPAVWRSRRPVKVATLRSFMRLGRTS